MPSLFRYSGSKQRLLKYLPPPPPDTIAIVEPFAGSLAYGLHHRPEQLLAFESNSDVRELIDWLTDDCSAEDLVQLEAQKPAWDVDVRTLGLGKPQTTLMRLMISGAYTGQLSCFKIYTQHSFKLGYLIEMLPYLKESVVTLGNDYKESKTVRNFAETFYFIDPPYVGTSGNYQDKSKKKSLDGGVDPAELTAFIRELERPFLFTYGDGAQEAYPDFDWQLACQRKEPILRGGGTRDRNEWFTTRFK